MGAQVPKRFSVKQIKSCFSEQFQSVHVFLGNRDTTLPNILRAFIAEYADQGLHTARLRDIVLFPSAIHNEQVDYWHDLASIVDAPVAIRHWVLSLTFEHERALQQYTWKNLLEHTPEQLAAMLELEDWPIESITEYLLSLLLKKIFEAMPPVVEIASEPVISVVSQSDEVDEMTTYSLVQHLFEALRGKRRATTDDDAIAYVEENFKTGIGPDVRHELNTNALFKRVGHRRYTLNTRDSRAYEYTGIADAIAREIQRAGGITKTADIIRKLAQRFTVRVAIIERYANLPRFVRTGELIRERAVDEPYFADSSELADLPGVFIYPGSVSLLVPITFELLVGGPLVLPDVVAWNIGLHPIGGPQKREFSGGGWTATTRWNETCPHGPQLFGLNEALNNIDAGRFRLQISGQSQTIRLFNIPNDISQLSQVTQLQLLTGAPGNTVQEIEEGLPMSINVAPGAFFGDISARLAVRGDLEVADLLRK